MRFRVVLGLSFLIAAGHAGPVFAQKVGKRAVPKALPKVNLKARKSAGTKGPKLRSEAYFRKRTKELVESKWKSLFGQLKKIIKSTPDTDPAKPELFYRLSELYRERADAISVRAFQVEDECLSRAQRDETRTACERRRKQTVNSSKSFREKAIKIYMHIVRNFPRYPRLDNVLFALAFNYQKKGNPDGAKKIYQTLIRKFPRSERVPDTLLNFGDIMFQDGRADNAARVYKQIIKNHKNAPVYGYARYKLGWCNYNLGKYREALGDFLDVLKFSKSRRGTRRNRLGLQKEAIRDIVRTYVHIKKASPAKAIRFFRKIAPDQYMLLSERLARMYGETGQFTRSNQMYRNLIKAKRRSYQVVSYQRAITENIQSMGNQVKAVTEVKRLVSLWRKVKGAKDAKPKRVARDKKGIELLLRTLATTYHRQASKTKSDQDYGVAFALYTDYMKTFPDGRDAYDMGYYFAELLMTLQKWGKAAEHYERIIKLKPKGEHSRDAAGSAVVAYKKLLNIKSRKSIDSVGNQDGKEIPKPKKIDGPRRKFIEANQRYLGYVRGQSMETDINYDVALIYFDNNHFDEAVPRFKKIAEEKPTHELAIYAANYLLDSFVLLKNYDKLNAQAAILMGRYSPEQHPAFHTRLVKIKQNATFNKCRGIEGKGDRIKAARCFLRYARDFPESEYVAQAMFNAAVNYEKERQIEKSIRALALIVNKASDSELMPKALFQIARNLSNLAIFSQASKAYEYYAQKFPRNKKALDALQNAAFYRMGLGQLDKAIKNYKAYMKLVGKKDREKASEVYFSIGKIFEQRKKWRKVITHYKDFLKKYGRVAKADLIIDAYTRIGNAYWRQAEPFIQRKRKRWRNFDFLNRPAQKAYNSAYQAYLKLSDKQKAALESGRAAAAEARFRMGEDIYIKVKYRTRLKPRFYRNVKKFMKALTKEIAARGAIINSARNIYGEVIGFRSPNWSIAALARQGEMLEALSNTIYNYPAPPKYTEDQKEAFKGVLTDRAEVYRTQAIDAYVLCMKTAQELTWFNRWSDNAEKRLSVLDPAKYRYNAELRAKPVAFGPSTIPQPVISSVEEYTK